MEEIVYALAATPLAASPRLIFAGRASGLYCSKDGGQTWQDALEQLELMDRLPVMTIALGKGESGSEPLSVFAGAPGGVLLSLDGGETWQVGKLPDPPPVVSCLALSPNISRDGVILAGTVEDGVFRSADQGRSWARWNFGLLDQSVFALAISPDFSQDETLFAGTETGIFRSANSGRSWREVNFPGDLAPVLSLALSPRYPQDGLILAGTEANGLILSQDHGRTWAPTGSLYSTATVNAILVDGNDQNETRFLALTDQGLIVSRDRGQTWMEWEKPASEEIGISCVAAPQGLAEGAPLLVGTVDGQVLWI